jgi:hypothetical protein
VREFSVQFDNGNGRFEWIQVHAERYKLRGNCARFYVGKTEVAYFYMLQNVVERRVETGE